MMTRTDEIRNLYFDWMTEKVCADIHFASGNGYSKLLMRLHGIEFTYIIPMDKNRAQDGIDLRYRFACEQPGVYESYLEYLDGPCSVLEMMIALAIRCEETIMDDTRYGNRTSQWFWGMVVNLGLGAMNDRSYDRATVDEAIDIFLKRDYAPNGRGGLFTVRNCSEDLRKVEIWYQLNWYLDGIV